ncbi:MAG TPA: hypothetical protein VEC14_02700, partial [Reyranellaceae bacterium]|nr:hypothetical protein [Reyranellaceae bacterium]
MMRTLALGLLAAVALLFALGRPIAWTEAALVVFDVASGGSPSSPWQLVTDEPVMLAASWPGGEGDLYRPVGRVRAALV